MAYLGHILQPEGVLPSETKVEAVKTFPVPTKIKHVRGFLGLTGFYRRFIKDYAIIAQPLYNLTKKDVPFKWTSKCQTAFNTLKEALISPELLIFPDFSQTFTLATDASGQGIGAVLTQEVDGEARPIGYAGRGLTPAETRYTTTEQELLAVVWGIQHFRVYLEGQKFKLFTDHSALTWILKLTNPQNRLARWVTFLQQFQYEVHHVKGVNNVVPDALSRRHYDVTRTEADDVIDRYPDIHSIKPQTERTVTFNEEISIIHTQNPAPLQEEDQLPWLPTDFDIFDYKFPFPQDHDGLAHIDTILVDSSQKLTKRQEKLLPHLQRKANTSLQELDLSADTIRLKQRQDPFCKQYINLLKFGKAPKNKAEAKALLLREEDFIILNDILYHIFTSQGSKPSNASAQLVVPQNLKTQLLQHHHDNDMAGHVGVSRVISRMRPRYYWPGMISDITEYVLSCKSCNAAKSAHSSFRPELTVRKPAVGPFHTLVIDTVGPLPRTKNGHKHIVCVTDQYSRYVIAWPTPDITAKSIAKKFFEKVICVYGAPKRLLSDNGTGFTSALFKELCSILNIRQIFSPSYSPTSQGQVERMQRSIVQLLRHYVNQKQTNWDAFLPQITWALNTSENQPLGFSSYLLLFGRMPTFPSEINLPDPLNSDSTIQEHLASILENQVDASKFAYERLGKEQEKMKDRYDRNSTNIDLKIGDPVYVFDPKLRVRRTRKKLQKSFTGPFIISKFHTPTSVILKRLTDGKILDKAVTVRRLKRGHVRARTNKWDPLPDPGPEIELSVEDVPESDLTDDPLDPVNTPGDQVVQPAPAPLNPTPDPPPTPPTDPPVDNVIVTDQPSSTLTPHNPSQTNHTLTNSPPDNELSSSLPDILPRRSKRRRVINKRTPTPKNTTASPIKFQNCRATRKNGVRERVIKVLGTKIDRQTNLIKYNCLFEGNRSEWILAPKVNQSVVRVAKSMGT